MNDFKGSVAEQNVTISTDIVRTAVVGGNFYQSMLYIFDRYTDFGSDTPVYPVVTRQTYKDVIDAYPYIEEVDKKLIKSNLEGLYYYNADVTVYIIPSTEYENYKLYGYFTYLDLKMVTTPSSGETDYNYDQTSGAGATAATMKSRYDKNFSLYLFDIPVDPSKAQGTDTTSTLATILSLNIPMACYFARPATIRTEGTSGGSKAWQDANGTPYGYSPSLYQLGWMLSFSNESGVPVGNQADMKALDFQVVLPTDGDGSDPIVGCTAIFAKMFEDNHINYFKPVGDGTSSLSNFGGWMINGKDAIVSEWIVAYENFMNRVACAKVITSGKALKNVRTYNALLDSVKANLVGMVKTGVITNFEMNPPSFDNLPITNGQAISIPNAWEADFVQTVHYVKISGTLTVAQ